MDCTDAHCNEVTLFTVDYNGCYDNNVVVHGVVYDDCVCVLYRAKSKQAHLDYYKSTV